MNNILELHQVCKTFPKQKNMKSAFTLDHVSFSLPYGAILGFVGENGAGKTTTIGCILNTIVNKKEQLNYLADKWGMQTRIYGSGSALYMIAIISRLIGLPQSCPRSCRVFTKPGMLLCFSHIWIGLNCLPV